MKQIAIIIYLLFIFSWIQVLQCFHSIGSITNSPLLKRFTDSNPPMKSSIFKNSKNKLHMSSLSPDIFEGVSSKLTMLILPLYCLEPTSKTTTTNDPTAGMTEGEIANYISNVGGGLCGLPEIVRDAIGLALNLSLLTFGIFTLGYGKSIEFLKYYVTS